MRIERYATRQHFDPYSDITFTTTSSQVSNSDGSTAFVQADVVVPSHWSQVAIDILAKKYFRKSGVARRLKPVEESGVPAWLWRSVPDEAALAGVPEAHRYGGEFDARSVFHRLAGATTYWGWKGGYFNEEEDARRFFDEIRSMLAHQVAAPNSPQWFNTGLHWAYGITGVAQGHYHIDENGDIRPSTEAFIHPQTHSCFIQSVEDDLVNEGGILPLFVDEGRIAKFGSGTGANFSNVRGADESLSGGGKACGLIAILKAGDRAAAVVTAKGSTRRSSKMVVVDVDHPDIEAFINWKVIEEQKVASLVTGSRICSEQLTKVMQACADATGEGAFDPKTNPGLKRAIRAARKVHVSDNYIHRAVQFARQGYDAIEFPVFDDDWDSEAYATVAGQNANNTVRVTDAFMAAVSARQTWDLIGRRDGKVVKTIEAMDLWNDIAQAAWASADPGIHFASTINAWHTCPAEGEIRASNSCSEYLFLDDTGATLASLNLSRFRGTDGQLDLDYFEYACRLWTIALEISVAMADYPSEAIARRTHRYRTLGLGFANLGGLLMTSGIPYDSREARSLCGALTAILSAVAYEVSAEMAGELGPFEGYAANRDAMLRVIRNHRRAAYGDETGYEGLQTLPVPLDHASLTGALGENGKALSLRAKAAWDRAATLGEQFGYRNAQASLIAPTGTIGLLMDCDTTGIEPDFALVKFKKLAGGGYFKIINHAIPQALRTLGYGADEVAAIERHVLGTGSLKDSPALGHDALRARGFGDAQLAAIEAVLPMAFDIRFAFNVWTLGSEFLTGRLHVPEKKLGREDFDLLYFLGFSKAEVEAGNVHACGAMTLEGAPHLRDKDLPVFDCANACGRTGVRFLSIESHIRMMAAAQSFLSGAISKTVNMPVSAHVEDCEAAYLLSWKLGLKANALYRDGSKLSQPLSAHRLVDDGDDDFVELGAVHADQTTDRIRLVAQTPMPMPMHGPHATPHKVPVREGMRHSAVVGGQRVLLQTRVSGDGKPAEVKLDVAELGGARNPLAGDIAAVISIGLQHGVPLDAYTVQFVPSPWDDRRRVLVDDESGRAVSTVMDHVFRQLGAEYLGRDQAFAAEGKERA